MRSINSLPYPSLLFSPRVTALTGTLGPVTKGVHSKENEREKEIVMTQNERQNDLFRIHSLGFVTLRSRESSHLHKTYNEYYSLILNVLKHDLP